MAGICDPFVLDMYFDPLCFVIFKKKCVTWDSRKLNVHKFAKYKCAVSVYQSILHSSFIVFRKTYGEETGGNGVQVFYTNAKQILLGSFPATTQMVMLLSAVDIYLQP